MLWKCPFWDEQTRNNNNFSSDPKILWMNHNNDKFSGNSRAFVHFRKLYFRWRRRWSNYYLWVLKKPRNKIFECFIKKSLPPSGNSQRAIQSIEIFELFRCSFKWAPTGASPSWICWIYFEYQENKTRNL